MPSVSGQSMGRALPPEDDLHGIDSVPSIQELATVSIVACIGAAACGLSLALAFDTRQDGEAVWQAILVGGLGLAAISLGLVLVGAQRRRATQRRLRSLALDFEDEVRAVLMVGQTESHIDALEERGRVIRRAALEAGAERQGREVTVWLRRLRHIPDDPQGADSGMYENT